MEKTNINYKAVNGFIKCVKDNYSNTLKLLALGKANWKKENIAYCFYLANLRTSYDEMETMTGVPVFGEETPEYEFFNNMIKKSKHLSTIAENVFNGMLDTNVLFKEIEIYCENMTEFYCNYSLFLKP